MPTTNATGIHTGASTVSNTHRRKYVGIVINRRRVEDTEVECENANACTKRERRRKSVGRTMLRCCRVAIIAQGEATIDASNSSKAAPFSTTVAFGPRNLK